MAALTNEYDSILEVIRSKQNRTYYNFELSVVVGGNIYPAMKVYNFDRTEDYELDYGPDVSVEVKFDLASYSRHIYPNRKNAKVIVTRTLMSEIDNEPLPGFSPLVGHYSLVDMNNSNLDMQALPMIDVDNTTVDLVFGLTDIAIDKMRLMRHGTIYYESNALDVLKYVLGSFSKQLDLSEELVPKGVTAVPGDVSEVREHIPIPQGTEVLAELPGLLQTQEGGIYNHHLGIFLKYNQWYIYPIYNTQRYQVSDKKLDIVVLPSNRAPGIERTYAERGNSILVSTTGEVKQKDVTDIDYLNNGNGIMFARASKLWDYVSTSKNRSTADRSKNLAEFYVVKRSASNQNAPFSSDRVTDNAADQISKLSKRRGFEMYLTWHNSNPDLLQPGMATRVHVMTEAGPKEYMATLLSVNTNSSPVTGEMLSVRYTTNSVLKLFVAL